ncbi:la-related protein 7-like [Tenebrio molitor]|jgi:La-related protein 7|uniref:la-related protein 7-like n=1 Tax=Tenebrio molitor TaxID=7067 RepID=UPI001C39C2F5|nr:unnamed protein product [Tenebrio molitor]
MDDSKVKESENASDEQTLKKGRHRKKQLYNSILQQMEFYFSDSNLSKDRFLAQSVKKNPSVDLTVFLKFNKLRKLTTNVVDIQKAVKNSKLIELSEDKNSVYRKEPIKIKTNMDECTIYVERLKSDATHEWLTSVFSEFGNVVYISLPKYKHNNAIKGFAFIEYENEAEAQKALNYFESIGCRMPSNTEPDQLCSIATFAHNNGQEEKEQLTTSTKKRKFDQIDDNNESEENEKKSKLEAEDISESEIDSENRKKKKLKKEHKKKNYIKELGLQVLSKNEWKKMRNRYLQLQRKKMTEFKRYLRKAKFSQTNNEENFKKPNEKTDHKNVKNAAEQKNGTDVLPKVEVPPGVIVKIKLSEPMTDVKKFKAEFKSSHPDAAYVDVPNPGSEDIYVRFKDNNSAANFCGQEFAGKKVVLTGDEEKAYLDKILKDRTIKCQKVHKKQRGRDKLLKKANKLIANHKRFDE